MRQIFADWRRSLGLLLLFGSVSASMFFTLAPNNSFPELYDIANHLVGIIEAKAAFLEGQFPLRVTPLVNNGWRYPLYQFYSPSSYMFTGLIYTWLTPDNPLIAYKIAIWFALVAGGIYMYRLALWFTGSMPAAILTGVVYITCPYLIVTINLLGAFNETLALGVLPAVIYYLMQSHDHPSYQNILLSSLSWYLLATVHLITFLCTSLFAAVFLLAVTVMNLKTWKNLIAAGSAYVFAALLAMWYLAPIVWLGKYLEIKRTFDYLIMYETPHLLDLLSPTIKLSSYLPDAINYITVTTHPIIGVPFLLAAGICIYACLNRSSKLNIRADKWLGPLLAVFFMVFLVIWSPVNFWLWLPKSFLILQYTWRMLSQIAWIGALLFAWSLYWLFKGKLDSRHTVLGILILVLIAGASAPSNTFNYVTFGGLDKKPTLVFNPYTYLIDARLHRNFANIYDSELIDPAAILRSRVKMPSLDSLQPDPLQTLLILNNTVNIKPSLLKLTSNPVIVLRGDIDRSDMDIDTPIKNLALTASINGREYASRDLQYGKFDWSIPIGSFRNSKKQVSLVFNVKDKQDSSRKVSLLTLPITPVLTGFLKPGLAMEVGQTQQHCQQMNEETTCTLMVPPATRLVELPIYYYPKMLNVFLNGKPVKYYSVFYKSYLITGIAPEPGKLNVIKFSFRGLMWANYLSAAAWQLWLIMLVYFTLKTRVREKQAAS